MKATDWVFELPLTTEAELKLFVQKVWGVIIPDVQVCESHTTPWRAFADAYFAKDSVTVWKASRGFGGKSYLLALLGLTEAVTLKANVNILGGSGEQSENVHKYMRDFWDYEQSPKSLLISDPSKRETRLAWGNYIKALQASQRSVRGPHPQRLRLDECLTGGTAVSTPNGNVRLDSIQTGDIVYGWFDTCGLTPSVVQSSKYMGIRKTKILILEDGREITGTGNHKIRTSQGWRCIGDIHKGDYLCSIGDVLYKMRETVLKESAMEQNRQEDGSLLKVLSEGDNERTTALPCMRKAQKRAVQDASRVLPTDTKEKSVSLCRLRETIEAAGIKEVSPLLASTLKPSWNDAANGCLQSDGTEEEETLQGRNAMCRTAGRVGHFLRATNTNGKVHCRFPVWPYCYRGSWQLLARQTSSQGQGRSKEGNVRKAGIPSSFLAYGSDASLVAVVEIRDGPIVPVYDIAVEDAHTFIANGIIVHNCDEMALDIFDAAMGQTMATEDIAAQTVASSTHQNANGTMTEVLQRATEKGWPVYEWCYKETMQGWLAPSEVERKRGDVTATMWDTEYDLQEPSPEARAILPEAVAKMFNRDLGVFEGYNGEYVEIEPPQEDGVYSHGADWAKKVDWTVIITLRRDVDPMRVVAFERVGRMPWPVMINRLDERVRRYGGNGNHDGTGIGDVVDAYSFAGLEPFIMVGRARSDLLTEYIAAIEREEIESPFIKFMHGEHKYASNEDVYGGGKGSHLPDTIAAGALAYSDTELHFG